MSTLANVLLKDSPLYVRTEGTVLAGEVLLREGQEASFDTYFGSLSVNAYKNCTAISTIGLRVVAFGALRIEIIVLNNKKDGRSEKKITLYAENNYEKAERTIDCRIAVPMDGLLYFKAIALSDQVSVKSAYYYAEDAPKNDVSLAVAICTYKREAYVKKNVQKIAEWKEISGEDPTVYVVDNGNTLTEGDVPGAVLIKNPNLGGSGGFCRGMAEAKKAGFTHVLLMDDDVSFESEIFGRILGFLRYVNEPDSVGIGASMIVEEKPTIQFELGATWDGDRLRGLGKEVDLTDPNVLLENATRDQADYTAWWCCCMPLSVTDKVGYPLPLFIKNDDVEYGIRSGLRWAFPSGVGVWHTSFESKYVPYLEYYIKRNELISNCLNRKRGTLSQFLKLVRSASLQLVQQRYFVIPFMMMGYEDFLKGPEYLEKLDAESKNKELIKLQPKQYTAEELLSMGYDVTVPVHGKKRRKVWQVVTLNGQLLPTFFYKKEAKTRVLDCNNCPPRDFFGATTTVQFNYSSGKGFVTKQKRTELFRWGFAFIKMAVKMTFTYRKVCKKYQEKAPYLTSLEYWKKQWRNTNE